MKNLMLVVLGLAIGFCGYSQEVKPPAEYGYQYFEIEYQNDPVSIIIQTKKDETLKKKPIILFGLGSTPRPLILLDDDGKSFQIFPFVNDSIINDYHLAVVGKPFIPVVAYQKDLERNQYMNAVTGIAPAKFCERDYVDYYVGRNVKVIEFLKQLDWVDSDKFILAGHSASATEMALTATQTKEATHLIYSCGNPFGRMMTMVSEARSTEVKEKPGTGSYYKWWDKVVKNKDDNTCPKGGDPDKTTFDFSQNHIN